jgi:hypothetical protein
MTLDIMQQFGGVWGELSAWAAVLTGLASLAGILKLIDRRPPVSPQTSADTSRLDRGQEWDRVMRQATLGLSREDVLAALHADSALKIESAEHAYNRLVADCARLCRAAEAPANDPVSPPVSSEPETPVGAPETPVSAPEDTPERTPLAA